MFHVIQKVKLEGLKEFSGGGKVKRNVLLGEDCSK